MNPEQQMAYKMGYVAAKDDAARRLASLTSPENIEKATEVIKTIHSVVGTFDAEPRELAEAVLRAVEEQDHV